MIDHIPYIHLIEVYNEKYFYDVNTNGIIHISDEMYDFLKNLLSKTSITRKQIGKEYSALSEECKSDIDLLLQKVLTLLHVQIFPGLTLDLSPKFRVLDFLVQQLE